jgi:hypothetical protein
LASGADVLLRAIFEAFGDLRPSLHGPLDLAKKTRKGVVALSQKQRQAINDLVGRIFGRANFDLDSSSLKERLQD